MNRMLKVIKSSPNPGALEMKIMVEKSSDNRFGFLRPKGKYSKDWEDMKSGKKKPAVVSSLVAYGSDSEEEEEEEDVLDDQLPVVKSDTAEDPEGHKQKKAKLEVDSDSVS